MSVASQAELVFRQHGGPRPHSGPKKRNRYDISHHARPSHDPKYPVHVMWRVRGDVPGLRQRRLYDAVRAALRTISIRPDFRVVHLSIQSNHLHLLVEADSTRALSRGMQGLAISTARRINRALGRRGSIFEYRYKAVPLTSPTQTRSTMSYVISNWRRHGLDRGYHFPVDWYSSGVTFDGWLQPVEVPLPEGYIPLDTSPPTTWLLGTGWRKLGALDPYARPGSQEISSARSARACRRGGAA